MAQHIASESMAQPARQSGPGWLRRLLSFAGFFLLIALVWEGSKLLFAIPDYKLPHLLQIAEAFARPTPKGPVALVLLNDVLYTAGEALTGFAIGTVSGFLMAVLLRQ
jgi:ABC-type nitrate/sulfonate/bicarbonate transport system permease component